jgi:hypothetical protein
VPLPEHKCLSGAVAEPRDVEYALPRRKSRMRPQISTNQMGPNARQGPLGCMSRKQLPENAPSSRAKAAGYRTIAGFLPAGRRRDELIRMAKDLEDAADATEARTESGGGP